MVVGWTHPKDVINGGVTYPLPRVSFYIIADSGTWESWFYPVDGLPDVDLRATLGGIAADDIGGFALAGSIHDEPGGIPSPTDAFLLECEVGSCASSFSKRWGGSNDDDGLGIAAGMGAWYVVGRTDSADFPTLRAVQPNYGGHPDGFLTRIVASAEARPQMSTYLDAGGCWGSPLGSDEAAAVAIDRSGPTTDRVYVAGTNVYEGEVPWVTSIVGVTNATPTIAYPSVPTCVRHGPPPEIVSRVER